MLKRITYEHAVFERVTSVLNNRDNVGTGLGHVDQITTSAVREFDSVHNTSGTNDIRNVGDGSTGGSTKVENLGTRANVDVLNTTEDGCGQLGTERIPDTVLGLATISFL